MSRKFLVPLSLPADPTQVLEATPKQYVDLRAVPAGGSAGQHLAKSSATDYALEWADPPSSGAGDQFTYLWKTTTTAVDPTSGGVKCNNADPSLATAVYISMYDSSGIAALWLLDLTVGMRFTLYEPGNVNTFIRYNVSGTVTNNANTWFSIPVTLHEEGTSGFTPNNNQDVQVGPARQTAALISNAELADMAQNRIKGRVTASTGVPEDLTPAQTRAVIASDAGGTTNFFRADGTFAAPAGGTGLDAEGVMDLLGLGALVEGAGVDIAYNDTAGTITLSASAEAGTGTKLSDLTAITTAANADLLEVVDASDTTMAASGTNKKMTLSQLYNWLAIPGSHLDLGRVANTDLAQMPANTIKGNNTGGVADPIDLTVAQIKTLLAIANTDVSGLGTMSTQAANSVAITGGSVTGITDITVADGGTGRSTGGTAYGLIAAGTTATGAQQTVTPAASGFLKTTNASALPAWTALTGADLANDSVTNTQLATMPTLTIKGNSTGSTAGPTDLTVAAVKSMLSINEIHVGTSAPGSPATGDLWVDTT